MNIYKYTCIKVDGTVYMYIYIHISTLYMWKRIHVYIYFLERKLLCSSGVPGGEVLKARMNLFLTTINLHLSTIRFDSFVDSILKIQNT